MPLTHLAQNAHAALTELAQRILQVAPVETRTFELHTKDLLPGHEPRDVVDAVGVWAQRGGRFIYYFETDASVDRLTALHTAVLAARNEKRGGRKYARLFAPSRVLYVGGSRKLRTRFREHLGYGHRAVYAMQLAHWAHDSDVALRFTAARYDNDESDLVLGALEDQLWSQLTPMLGRQGRQ